MNEPTPALDVIVERGVRPRVEYLSGIVARMLECDPREARVLRCVASIQAQALSYLPNPVAARLGFQLEPTPERIEEVARHVAAFSIAGIRGVKRVGAGTRPGR